MSYYCGHPKAEHIPVYRAYALVDKTKVKCNNDYISVKLAMEGKVYGEYRKV